MSKNDVNYKNYENDENDENDEKISIYGANLNRIHLTSLWNYNLGEGGYLNIVKSHLDYYKNLNGQLITITIMPNTDNGNNDLYFPNDFYTIFIVKLPKYKAICGCDIYIGINVVGKELSDDITIKSWDFEINKTDRCKFYLELYSDKLDKSYKLKYKGTRINFKWFANSDAEYQCNGDCKKKGITSMKLIANIILSNNNSNENLDIKNIEPILFNSFSPEGSNDISS